MQEFIFMVDKQGTLKSCSYSGGGAYCKPPGLKSTDPDPNAHDDSW